MVVHVFHKSFLLKPNGYRRRHTKQTQVISLEEFVIHDADEEVSGATGRNGTMTVGAMGLTVSLKMIWNVDGTS